MQSISTVALNGSVATTDVPSVGTKCRPSVDVLSERWKNPETIGNQKVGIVILVASTDRILNHSLQILIFGLGIAVEVLHAIQIALFVEMTTLMTTLMTIIL